MGEDIDKAIPPSGIDKGVSICRAVLLSGQTTGEDIGKAIPLSGIDKGVSIGRAGTDKGGRI